MAKDKKETYQTIRMPLVGSYFHRTDDTELYLTDNKDQQFVNCYFSKISNPLTGGETFKVKKRPGWVAGNTYAGVVSDGILSAVVWNGFDGDSTTMSIWKTGANTAEFFFDAVSVGSLSVSAVDEASQITLSRHAGNQTVSFWVDGGDGVTKKAYYSDGVTITEITDVDFPDANIKGNFVFMDGYAFIMTTRGDIYNSDLNSLSAWTSTSFIESGARPDIGVTVARYKDKLVAFNTASIEFFELNPTPPTVGSVLQRVNHLAILDIGCYNGQLNAVPIESTLAKVEVLEFLDTLFWITGGGTSSETAIYMLNNYQPVKVSTPEVDALLSMRYTLAGAFNFQGYNYIALYNSAVSNFFLFNLETKGLYRWTFGFTTGTFAPIISGATGGTDIGGMGAITTFRGTKNYKIEVNPVPTSLVYEDDTNPYTMKIQTSRIDLGTNKRKRLHKLDVIGDKQGTANNLSINWSDNDYTSFTTARTVAMGDDRPYLNNCGIFRRRAFKLEHSANTACELEALELQLSMMES